MDIQSLCLQPDELLPFAYSDANRILELIEYDNAFYSPFSQLFPTGTFPAGYGQQLRALVTEDAAPADPNAYTAPTFATFDQTCKVVPCGDSVGLTPFYFQLGVLKGRGPEVCVKQAFETFVGQYEKATESLRDMIVKIIAADTRFQATILSGVKVSCVAGVPATQTLTGGKNQVGVPFPSVVATGEPSFKYVRSVANYLATTLQTTGFKEDKRPDQSPVGEHMKAIFGNEIIDKWRDEIEIREDVRFLAMGGIPIPDGQGKSERYLQTFHFEGPYRGMGWARDPQPLRLSAYPTQGIITPDLTVNPTYVFETAQGTLASRPGNPDWDSTETAPFELGFVQGPRPFKRHTPQRYNGEGQWKFMPQMYAGELDFKVLQSPEENQYGENGRYYYQIGRAFEPLAPHRWIPIIFARCPFVDDTTYCANAIV